MVVSKIIRAVDKDQQVASLSVLETALILKTSWDEISEKTIQIVFVRLEFPHNLKKVLWMKMTILLKMSYIMMMIQ